MQLRPYQQDAFEKLRHSLRTGHHRPLLVSPTGSGKTVLSAAIIKAAVEKDKRVLFLAPRRELIYQAANTFQAFGIDARIVMAGEAERNLGMVQVASKDTLYVRGIKRRSMCLPPADLVISDECFTPDVEILTEDGFVRFDNLAKGKRVAQYDEGNISFVQPHDYIERDYSGEMIRLYSDKYVDLDMTPGHELLVKWPDGWRKQPVNKVNFNVNKKMAVAGLSSFEDDGLLTPYERLIIALQADGSVRRETSVGYSVDFQLTKSRKIEALKRIAGEGNFKISEVKGAKEDGNTGQKRRFLIHRLSHVSKDLTEHFDITRISAKKAKAIIDEAMNWDGHVSKNHPNLLYFSSTNESAVDFYQSVALLAGYRTRKTIQKDNRKETYKDVHRLFIQNGTQLIGCQAINKESWHYEGKIYCVRVPTGNIVVRRNGRPLIIGNCHLSLSKSWRAIFDAYSSAPLIGLTATPAGPKGRGLGEIYDDLVQSWSVKDLTEAGYLVPVKYYGPSQPDLENIGIRGGDYIEKDLDEAMDQPQLVGDIVQNWKRLVPGRRTVVFCVTRKHGRHICEEFVRNDVRAEYVDGETPDNERKGTFERVRSGKTQVLVNVLVATYGLDLPPLDCAVLARPTRDLTLYLQCVGRILRPCKETGKQDAIVIDHAGAVELHGFVDDPFPWDLNGKESVQERREKQRKERKEPKELKCPKCTTLFKSSRTCPSCGYQMIAKGEALPVYEAELSEIEREKAKRNKDTDYLVKAQFYAQLVWYERDKGYKKGFAAHKYREAMGVWPNDKRLKEVEPFPPTLEVRNWIKSRQIAYAKARTAA